MNSYQGVPGGPSDPATPGPYCLTRCYCATCPQHAEQTRQTEFLRQQEYAQRENREAERAARREQHRGHARSTTPRTAA